MSINLREFLSSIYRGRNSASRLERIERLENSLAGAEVLPVTDENEHYHTRTVNEYYDLCTELMAYSWSESLHFAPLRRGERLKDAIIRHQRLMIEKLELRDGMRVIDVGCGVGGPMRRVAREANVNVVCLNNNEYQLEQTRIKNIEADVDHLAEYVKCSFMDMTSIESDSLDAAYAIESTCHAPHKVGAFQEIFRVLKPGALFWGQEMCLTDRFDPDSFRHQTIKDELKRGIALADIASFGEVNRALEAAGFEIVEAMDREIKDRHSTPWYQPMVRRNGMGVNTLLRTPLGRKFFLALTSFAESLGFIPKGSHGVVGLMQRTGKAYIAGGKEGIFTPLYCFLARKPG